MMFGLRVVSVSPSGSLRYEGVVPHVIAPALKWIAEEEPAAIAVLNALKYASAVSTSSSHWSHTEPVMSSIKNTFM
jgi:hypothetical protein